MNTTVRGRALTVGGAALLLGATTIACSSAPEPVTADAAAPLAVTVATASMSAVGDTFEAGGMVQARTTATLTARVLAPVMEIRVAPGDRVRTGQVLLVLDGRELGAQVRLARAHTQAASHAAESAAAEERAAQASLVLARATHDRIAALQARKSATAQELDSAVAALRAAEARMTGASARVQEAASGVEVAQAGSEAADVTESYTRITAPFDGVVTEKMVEPGNMAAPGAPLMRVEDTRAFRLDVRVDESRLGPMAPGAVGGIVVGAAVVVRFDADAGVLREVKGVVSEISRAMDADTRAFLVKIDLQGGAANVAGLRSGMFGRARFSASQRQALTVPADAVVRQGQVTSVFVVENGVENGVARLRLVRLRDTEVLAGLSAGEVVIVSPVPGLADGRRVTTSGSRP